ncbi:BREX system ATP-binding domain-containing protein [Rhizobium leguminosarum]|uniref:BREX system ATP-binding domain-containing protein n=1 Tax=Rhizobium leguminosarum TaxID=384 RepID=UPI003F9628D9
MSLREKLAQSQNKQQPDLFAIYGVLNNPFPASSQTSHNPRRKQSVDELAEARIMSFLRDQRSQVVVVEGTQGVGKTNFLNHFEAEIEDALSQLDGYYVVRYLADPEASFDGTIRRLFQELGEDHIEKLAEKLEDSDEPISSARSQDMRSALQQLSNAGPEPELIKLFMDWLYGGRLLKAHKERLNIHFRLDTVESKTAALRDLVVVSSEAGILNGIFLLLDELEKQDGILSPTAVVRYLSAMRAIIDSLPQHLFMMIAVTPDALRRYSNALPAFRSRLQNQITLNPLLSLRDGKALANFYLDFAKREAAKKFPKREPGRKSLITPSQIEDIFEELKIIADRRGDRGVPQRVFLHRLHATCEETIQDLG